MPLTFGGKVTGGGKLQFGGTNIAAQSIAGCGAGAGGADIYDQSTCGNVGDPYEGGGTPAAPQTISACGTVDLSLGSARLNQNISAATPDLVCLTVINGGGTNFLDLGGFTVSGIVKNSNGVAFQPSAIFNGTINCSRGGTAVTDACLSIDQPGGAPSFTNQIRFHHLTINNQIVCNSGSPCHKQTIFVDWGGTVAGHVGDPTKGGTADLRFDHITMTLDNCTSGGLGTRNNGFRITTGYNVQIDNNLLTIGSNAGSAQGMLTISYTSSNLFQNNKITVADCGACLDDSTRAMMFDTGNTSENDGAGSPNSVMRYNYVSCANARCVRIRNCRQDVIRDNRFVGILQMTAVTNTGSIHLGDPDAATYDLGQTFIDSNTFVLAGNTPTLVWARNSLNGTIQNNTVIPGAFTGGYFGYLRSSTADTKVFKNNNMGGWTGTAGVVVNTEAGTTAHVCNSGTGGGAGTVDAICP